jgi:hypothetical protein
LEKIEAEMGEHLKTFEQTLNEKSSLSDCSVFSNFLKNFIEKFERFRNKNDREDVESSTNCFEKSMIEERKFGQKIFCENKINDGM